jgi:hypothetical protein
MVFTFSLFKNDIDNFSNEDYYKNNENFTDFYCFLDFYKDIINDDNKKPVFIQSSKNKKNNSNLPNSKGYKYFKINRDNEEINNKKGWSIKNFIKDDEKNIVFIKTTLNKISDETYEVISNELLNEIHKMDYDDSIFEILTHEIINKCIYEYKYRKLYINLCSKLWNDIDFHKKIFFVEKDEDNKYFYVNKSSGESSDKLFNTIESLYEYIFVNNNFKKYFVNNLKNIIYGFDNTYFVTDELTEEEISKKKKYYLGIFDIVNVLFVEKYISIDVINILIVKLLHLNDTFEIIQSLEYEALYNIVKLMSNVVFNFTYYSIFYKEIINYCKQILESSNLSKRNSFFLSEIIELLNKFINYDNIQNSKKVWTNNDSKKIIKDNFKNNNFKACKEIIIKSSDNDRQSIINSLLLFIIEQKNISADTIKFLNELNVKDVEKEFYILCNNIDDILLDIPNANIKFIKLFNELNITKKNNILLMLENINDDDYTDDDE